MIDVFFFENVCVCVYVCVKISHFKKWRYDYSHLVGVPVLFFVSVVTVIDECNVGRVQQQDGVFGGDAAGSHVAAQPSPRLRLAARAQAAPAVLATQAPP